MSIKNYIDGDINDIHLIVNSHKINTYDLNIDGKLQIKSVNGDVVNYTTPSKGIAGEQLTIDVNGNTYWGSSGGGGGGISNPLSDDLNGNQFNLDNINVLTVNNINPNNSGAIIMSGDVLTLYGNSKTFIESGADLELECNAGSNIRMTNDITLQGNALNLNASSGIIDMNNGTLTNLSNIDGYATFKNIDAGTTINFNGRMRINVSTTSMTPLLLFKIQYNNGCSVYDGRFMAFNLLQGKIWCCPAVCVVELASIDKNIAGSNVASIGGTTRASTIDFNINTGYLECWITPNFTDNTVNIFECSIWSDIYN
jgi:hypothetical protein